MIEHKTTLSFVPADMYTLLADPINHKLFGGNVLLMDVTAVKVNGSTGCFEVTVAPQEEEDDE